MDVVVINSGDVEKKLKFIGWELFKVFGFIGHGDVVVVVADDGC